MFSSLDSIDWRALGYHTYSRHEEIPRAIRDLLSPDETVRREALGFLLGEGQDFGDIYDTTPKIIPFCLEVLANDGAPGKAELMQQLSGQGRYIADARDLSIHRMELCLQSYAALRSGLDRYLELLARGERDERLAACELLQYLTDEPERLIPTLLERVDLETDEEVQVSLLYCLKRLLASLEWPRYSLKERYAPSLRMIVESHPSNAVRVAAARASLELAREYAPKDDLLSSQVGEILLREFLQPGPPMNWTEGYPSIQQENLVADLARLADPASLLRLLAEPGITSEQAHLLARGLLCQTFIHREQHARHWRQLASYEQRKVADIFIHEHGIPPWQLKAKQAQTIMRAIIEADRVWERPTNLFSFFYGLPDSREGMRSLVEKAQPNQINRW